jgi:hypothetical protein
LESSKSELSECGKSADISSLAQDMAEFDSHLSDFELPLKLLDLDDVLHPKNHDWGDSSSFTEDDCDDDSDYVQKSENIEINARAELLPSDKFFLAMGTLNSSFCMAQCGYLSRAVDAIYRALGNDFNSAIMINMAVFNLLRKKPDMLQAILYLKMFVE